MLLAWQIGGVLTGAAGVAALYLAWQRKKAGRALTAFGWALVAVSILAWSRTSGIDKGPALGILSFVLIALVALGVSALRTPPRSRRAQRVRIAPEGGRSLAVERAGAKALMLAVIVLMGFAAALAACGALFIAGRSAGFEHTGNLAAAMFAFPLVWAGLATWLGYAARPARGAAILAGILAAALPVIGLGMWGA